uniref:Uncharacterized protein n=1 Tax=Cacopsylla melanoneura TaxID=428564 RepID=A0A8D8YVF1_9HEMI
MWCKDLSAHICRIVRVLAGPGSSVDKQLCIMLSPWSMFHRSTNNYMHTSIRPNEFHQCVQTVRRYFSFHRKRFPKTFCESPIMGDSNDDGDVKHWIYVYRSPPMTV